MPSVQNIFNLINASDNHRDLRIFGWRVKLAFDVLLVMTKSRYPVFWGAAIVIFLAKIINFHNDNTQGFWVEVSAQVETGVLNFGLKLDRLMWHF